MRAQRNFNGKGENKVACWSPVGFHKYGSISGTRFLGPLSDGHELRKSFGANNFATKALPSAGQ